jgi:hypothetical protein
MKDDELLLDWSDLTDADLVTVPCVEIFPSSSSRRRRQYLRGPLDWQDLCAVAKLPGKALAVWLLLHLRWPMVTGVTLPNPRLAEMGVDCDAKARALRILEGAGFIRVERRPGCAARITILRRRVTDRSRREDQ